jgi:hypothetical protein
MMVQHANFEVFADYHQFYLWDRSMYPQAPEHYSKEDIVNRINCGPHMVAIVTVGNETVSVRVELHDSEPDVKVEDWSHVVEVSISVPSGQLQVHECTGGAVADFAVAPGDYRLRSHLRMDAEEFHCIALWPAAMGGLQAIKRFQPN